MSQTMGKKIVALRKQKDMGQRDLARLANVNPATLNKLEKGTRQGEMVAIGTVKRLARVLGVTLDYLGGMYDDEPLSEDAPAAADLIGV